MTVRLNQFKKIALIVAAPFIFSACHPCKKLDINGFDDNQKSVFLKPNQAQKNVYELKI